MIVAFSLPGTQAFKYTRASSTAKSTSQGGFKRQSERMQGWKMGSTCKAARSSEAELDSKDPTDLGESEETSVEVRS